MPFCPSCRTEYRADVTKCSDCGTELVANLEADKLVPGERMDVYVCYREQQVIRVVGVLEEAGIEALVRDRTSSAFPTNVDAERIVAVPAHETVRAREVIQTAIDDEVLLGDGKLLSS